MDIKNTVGYMYTAQRRPLRSEAHSVGPLAAKVHDDVHIARHWRVPRVLATAVEVRNCGRYMQA